MENYQQQQYLEEGNNNENNTAGDVWTDINLPPGYRFCPTDEELVKNYLINQAKGTELPPNRIHIVELYSFSPKQLTENYKMQGINAWYFFTPRNRKYPNGNRPNRAAGDGYWKPTGVDDCIINDNARNLGYKMALDFYEGKNPRGKKTDWKMHEYRIQKKSSPPSKNNQGEGISNNDLKLDQWVLCRIYLNTRKKKNKDEVSQQLIVPGDTSVAKSVATSATSNISSSQQVAILNASVSTSQYYNHDHPLYPQSFSHHTSVTSDYCNNDFIPYAHPLSHHHQPHSHNHRLLSHHHQPLSHGQLQFSHYMYPLSHIQQPFYQGQQQFSHYQQPISHSQQSLSQGQQLLSQGQQPLSLAQQPLSHVPQPLSQAQQPISHCQQLISHGQELFSPRQQQSLYHPQQPLSHQQQSLSHHQQSFYHPQQQPLESFENASELVNGFNTNPYIMSSMSNVTEKTISTEIESLLNPPCINENIADLWNGPL